MVGAACISSDDTVVEIGPGKGILTQELLETGATVIAIEKDPELIPLLSEKFVHAITSGKLTLMEGDILDIDLAKLVRGDTYKLVANIPYYITGEIMRFFLSAEHQPSSITMIIQKEVAERIVCRDGKESVLSLSVKVYGTPHYIKKVPARYFSPEPKIDSAILYIDNISRKKLSHNNERAFFSVVKSGFLHKRKLLANNIGGLVSHTKLSACGIAPGVRAEEVSLEQWLCLSSE